MSFTALSSGSSIGGMLTQICVITPQAVTRDAMGFPYPTDGTPVSNVPCTLQPMSTANSMIYKAESAASMFDLFLPLRVEGSATDLAITVGTEFTVDSVKYRVVGEGMRQGQGGVQRVPVQKVNR